MAQVLPLTYCVCSGRPLPYDLWLLNNLNSVLLPVKWLSSACPSHSIILSTGKESGNRSTPSCFSSLVVLLINSETPPSSCLPLLAIRNCGLGFRMQDCYFRSCHCAFHFLICKRKKLFYMIIKISSNIKTMSIIKSWSTWEWEATLKSPSS